MNKKAITLKDALDETQHWLFCDLDRIQGENEKEGKIETIRLSARAITRKNFYKLVRGGHLLKTDKKYEYTKNPNSVIIWR